MKPFDASHPRCIFPQSGFVIDKAMQEKGYTNTALSKLVGLDHTAIAGYRRGFSRPSDDERIAKLQELLGVELDLSEPTPSEKARLKALSSSEAPAAQECDAKKVLDHLAAAALALGYKAEFTPAKP